jgi:hypothetical protein
MDGYMISMPASNGNGESPTTNTTTYSILLSLLSLTGPEVKWFWGYYFWRCCNGVAKKTMEWREILLNHPTLLCCCD